MSESEGALRIKEEAVSDEEKEPKWFGAGIEVSEDASSDDEAGENAADLIGELNDDDDDEEEGERATTSTKAHLLQNPVSGNFGNRVKANCEICCIAFATALAAEKHFQRVHIQHISVDDEEEANKTLKKKMRASTLQSENRMKKLMKEKFKDLSDEDEDVPKGVRNPLWWALERNPCLIANPEVYERAEREGEEAQKLAEKIDFRNKDMRSMLKIPSVSVNSKSPSPYRETVSETKLKLRSKDHAPELSISVIKQSALSSDRKQPAEEGDEKKSEERRKLRIVKVTPSVSSGGAKGVKVTPSISSGGTKTIRLLPKPIIKESVPKNGGSPKSDEDGNSPRPQGMNFQTVKQEPEEEEEDILPRKDGRTRRSAAPTDFSALYNLEQEEVVAEPEAKKPKAYSTAPAKEKPYKPKRSESSENLHAFLRHNAELGRLKAVEEGIMTTERYICVLCGVSLIRKCDIQRHVSILHYQLVQIGVPVTRIGLKRDLREEETALFKKNSLSVKMAFMEAGRLEGEERERKERSLAAFLNRWKPDDATVMAGMSKIPISDNLPLSLETLIKPEEHLEVPAFAAEVALNQDGEETRKVNLDPSGRPGRKPGQLSYMKGVSINREKTLNPRFNVRPPTSFGLAGIGSAPQVMKRAEAKPNLNLHRAFFSRGMPLPKHCRKIRLEIDLKDGMKRSMYQYQCDLCQENFSDRPNIISHLQSQHDVGFFPCNQCKTILPTTTELELHIRTKHEV